MCRTSCFGTASFSSLIVMVKLGFHFQMVSWFHTDSYLVLESKWTILTNFIRHHTLHPLVPNSCCFTVVSEGHLLPHVQLMAILPGDSDRNQCHVVPLCRFDRTVRPRNRSSEDPVSLRGQENSVFHNRFGYQLVFPFWYFVDTIPIKGKRLAVSPVLEMDLGSVASSICFCRIWSGSIPASD